MTSSRGLVHSIEGFSARAESQRAGILSQGSRLICAERALRRGTFVAYLAKQRSCLFVILIVSGGVLVSDSMVDEPLRRLDVRSVARHGGR
jgi:hypothetical protein